MNHYKTKEDAAVLAVSVIQQSCTMLHKQYPERDYVPVHRGDGASIAVYSKGKLLGYI